MKNSSSSSSSSNVKKLCLYCLDCVKSTSTAKTNNIKSDCMILSDDLIFKSDDKAINELLIKSKLNQSTMQLIYGFKYFIKELNTPLLYYTDVEIIRDGDNIRALINDDNLQINFNFLANLFENDIEIIEIITSQLINLSDDDLKNIDFKAVLMGLIGDKLKEYTIINQNALMLVKMPENTAGLINELKQIEKEY